MQFFRTSGLDDMTLGGIWQVADQDRRGRLNKQEFFLATKLVALKQQGTDATLDNVNVPAAVPRLGQFTEQAVKLAEVRC